MKVQGQFCLVYIVTEYSKLLRIVQIQTCIMAVQINRVNLMDIWELIYLLMNNILTNNLLTNSYHECYHFETRLKPKRKTLISMKILSPVLNRKFKFTMEIYIQHEKINSQGLCIPTLMLVALAILEQINTTATIRRQIH